LAHHETDCKRVFPLGSTISMVFPDRKRNSSRSDRLRRIKLPPVSGFAETWTSLKRFNQSG